MMLEWFDNLIHSQSPAHPAPPSLKLGRLPAKQDARTFELANYLAPATQLPRVPPAYAWSPKVTTGWPMLDNDVLGCCTISAVGHEIQLWEAANGKVYAPSDADVIAAYSAVSGYDPATGANDNGAVLLDVLNYWRTTGLAGHKIAAFMSIPITSPKLLMTAIYLFGGAYIGLDLPLSAQKQVAAGQPWTYTGSTDSAAGSWGGHCVSVHDFGPTGCTCITWGRKQFMTWQFLARYMEECWAVLSTDWLDPATGRAPNMINLAHLQADLRAL